MVKDSKFILKRFLFSGLRRLSRFFPAKNAAIKLARVDRGVYRCVICKKEYKREDIVVDHIAPVIDPKVGFVDWNIYIDRLFCDVKGLQVLCDKCHTIKTNKENKERRKK